MRSKKLINSNGSTRKVIVKHPSGMYSSYTPKEAAQMIIELRNQLWSGVPITNKDIR